MNTNRPYKDMHPQGLRTIRESRLRGQRGTLLIETLVALAIMSTLGVVLLQAIRTSHVTKAQFDQQATADVLLRDQIESAFAENYVAPGGSYTSIAGPEGYTIAIQALPYVQGELTIETVRVTVSDHGTIVRSLDTLRASR